MLVENVSNRGRKMTPAQAKVDRAVQRTLAELDEGERFTRNDLARATKQSKKRVTIALMRLEARNAIKRVGTKKVTPGRGRAAVEFSR